MTRFAIRTPYFIVVACLVVAMLGIVSVVRLPVDMFPTMNIPVVAVASFRLVVAVPSLMPRTLAAAHRYVFS